MMGKFVIPAIGFVWWSLLASGASAERLNLDFLPPDLPPSDLCSADTTENIEPNKPPESPIQSNQVSPELEEYLGFLQSDIRNLTREDADGYFDYISALLSFQAQLDPEMNGIEEAFARIDLFIAAERFDALQEARVVPSLAVRREEITNNQRVQLAQFYFTGIGVERDPVFGAGLLTDAAFRGNANALLFIVRMQMAGAQVDGWDMQVEETATIAFGGMIGQLNAGICDRAERMAREYLDGDILAPNPNLAFAWRKFAADQGGQEAAWRVVEHHLSAAAADQDNTEFLHYLNLAIGPRREVTDAELAAVMAAGADTVATIKQALTRNHGRASQVQRRSAVPFLDLQMEINRGVPPAEGSYLQYLRDIAEIPGAPGSVHRRLAKEIMLQKGRWAAEAEVIPILELAVQLGDTEAAVILSEIFARHRDDAALLTRAQQLLIDAVSLYGHTPALTALDDLYRCQLPSAPMLDEARFWARAYDDAEIGSIPVSANDLARLDPTLEPEIIAKLQTLALRGQGSATADFLQFLQSDPLALDATLRFWAGRVSRSDRALEDFARQEVELAQTRGERQDAIELIRRAYLQIGAAINLDLAVALVEHAGRDPQVAEEIRTLLDQAGQRGEGAAIRLLQRLTQADAGETYVTYRDAIERNGDFLAFMVAAPHVRDEDFGEYMNRAISVMNCSSKDIAELADAYTLRGHTQEAAHWLRIGLSIEGGHILSRLGLNDWQIAYFAEGRVKMPDLKADEIGALRREFLRAADPNGPDFNADLAATLFLALVERSGATDWTLRLFRLAAGPVQRAIERQTDMRPYFETAAQSGDPAAVYEFGMLLRKRAKHPEDLTRSADLLHQAARAGHSQAMNEFAFALGFGLGVPADPKTAIIWLHKAQSLSNRHGAELLQIFTAMVGE